MFPSELKHSSITPIIKDYGADFESFKNYRPISNTPKLAKIIEKTALYHIDSFLVKNSLHNSTPSGCKKFHAYEKAMVKILNDTQSEILKKNGVVLLMLDISSAFDTTDQCLLIEY